MDHDEAAEMLQLTEVLPSVQENSRSTKLTCDTNFPTKLHYMLEEINREGIHHIVSWLPHGRSFRVHKQLEFERDLLPL
jgi:HSF-type DNA-binding